MTDQTLEQLEREYLKRYCIYCKCEGWIGHKNGFECDPCVCNKEHYSPLTETEYFGSGGLLDKLPEFWEPKFAKDSDGAPIVTMRDRGAFGARTFYISYEDDGSRSEALKKAILMAHLKGNE